MKKQKDKDPISKAERAKKIRGSILYWVILNIGVFILALGVALFKGPNNFATGGVSGVGIILSKFITPLVPFLTQSVIMLSINSILIIIGFIFLGKGCTFKTAYCSILYTIEMWIMERIFEYYNISLPFTDQKLLEFVYAMLLTGIASAIIFNCKASSGGTDIIALIIKKYSKMDIGKALLITDLLIASSAFFVFDTTTGLYSILGLFSKMFLVDGVIESIGKSKFVTIITTKAELITPFIIEGLHRGYTTYAAEGGYTGEPKKVILTVCKRSEALKLKIKIYQVDPSAFVILTDTNEILGKGFRTSIE